MKGIILIVVITLTEIYCQDVPPVGSEYNTKENDGSYRFGYRTGDAGAHYHAAVATRDNQVVGRFGSRDPSTRNVVETQYTAGRRGFRARGPNIARTMDISQNKIPYNPPVNPNSPNYKPSYDSYHDPNEDPSYDFGFRTPVHSRKEKSNSLGFVNGEYSFLDDVGQRHDVIYEAGAKTGFKVLTPFPDSAPFTANSFYRGTPSKPGGKTLRGTTSIQQGGDGSYRFISTGPDQRRTEASDSAGNVRGSYTYVDDKGQQRTVEYMAGPNIGYRIIKKGKGPNFAPAFPFNLPASGSLQPFADRIPGRPFFPPVSTSDFFGDGEGNTVGGTGGSRPGSGSDTGSSGGPDSFDNSGGSNIGGDNFGSDFGRPGSDFGRPGNDFGRPGSNFDRPDNDFGRPGSDIGRPGNDFNRPGSDFNRPGNDFNRPGNDFNRPGGDLNRPGGDLNRPGGDFGRPGNDFGRPSGDFGRPGSDFGDNFGRPGNDFGDDFNRPSGNRPGGNRPFGNRPNSGRPGGNRPGGGQQLGSSSISSGNFGSNTDDNFLNNYPSTTGKPDGFLDQGSSPGSIGGLFEGYPNGPSNNFPSDLSNNCCRTPGGIDSRPSTQPPPSNLDSAFPQDSSTRPPRPTLFPNDGGDFLSTPYDKLPPKNFNEYNYYKPLTTPKPQQSFDKGDDNTFLSSNKNYYGFPHGIAIRAHVQSVDILPFGSRIPPPSVAIEKNQSPHG